MLTHHLQTIDTIPLNVFSNNRDLLRDLFTYLGYIAEHSVKRMTRTNQIPRGDSIKIAKLLGDKELVQAAQESGGTQWLDFIDVLAYRMHLTHYDVKGTYRGYSSSDASFVDNFISINNKNLDKFNLLSPLQQEKQILEALINAKTLTDFDNYSFNEFFQSSVFGTLDQFSTRGSATGLVPNLKFPEVRQFLIKILQECTPNQWYSTASLISYLKTNHPYFLIPENAPKTDRWGKPIGRYDNFYEGNDYWASEFTVPTDAPDAFERVEGRYLERFLENIPLLMRFVDVAYDTDPYTGLRPMRGVLKAFRITERFQRFIKGEMVLPKITIQPNFDVIIESDFYPGALVNQISELGELVSSPESGHGAYVGIFLLKKTAIATALVKQPDLDLIALLKELSGRDLPANVQVELSEWAGHADQFTLYEGFAILETTDIPPEIEKFSKESISPALHLVKKPADVFATLEKLGKIPLLIQHPDQDFARIDGTVDTLFPKESIAVIAPKTVREVKVGRIVTISYKFPEADVLSALQKILVELRCPFQSDHQNRIISIKQQDQSKFDAACTQLASDYNLEIEKN